MIKIQSSISSLATHSIIYATRGIVSLGLPAYLISQMHSIFSQKTTKYKLLTAVLVVLSAPSTLLCALGALEGSIRSGIKLGNYSFHRKHEQANYLWDQFCKEASTTHGLIRGALSPISGYTIIGNELGKEGPVHPSGTPRIIKEEYLVYRSIRACGRLIVEIGRQTVHALQWVGRQIIWGIKKLWDGVCYIKDSIINLIHTTWRVSKPILTRIWDAILKGAEQLWQVTQPLRTFTLEVINSCLKAIRRVVWDFAIKTVVVDWIFTRLLWNIGVKIFLEKILWPPIKFIATKIIWDFVIKTIFIDWFLTKLVWDVGMKILLKQVVWPPIKFIATNIIWPIVRTIGIITSAIVLFAVDIITWTTKQAFRIARN